MTPDQRAELARLAEEATPGPWEAREQPRGEGARAFGVWLINNYAEQSGYPGAALYGVRAEADAAYIVAACNEVPALLADIERLKGALREVETRAALVDHASVEDGPAFARGARWAALVATRALATGASVPADSGEKP